MNRILIALILGMFPCIASANAGVPMLFVIMPSLAWSIIPIIAVETVYLARKIELTNGQSFVISLFSNAFSTFIGIPLVWLLMIGVSLLTGGGNGYGKETYLGKLLTVTVGSAWLMPYDNSELNWLVPLAWTFLLLPFFFASWFSERYIARKLLVHKNKDTINIACRNANAITYSALALWPLVNFISSLVAVQNGS